MKYRNSRRIKRFVAFSLVTTIIFLLVQKPHYAVVKSHDLNPTRDNLDDYAAVSGQIMEQIKAILSYLDRSI